jgi:predicted RND superfamily exporter protein
VRHPWRFLALALFLTAPAVYLARQLELHTGFDALLPENKPSVIELKRVASRTAGVSTLAVVIDGNDPAAMQRFSDALLPKLRALGPDWIGTAENGVHAEREFMKERQALYLPLTKVQEIHQRIEERYQKEIFGSLDDEPLEPITRESLEQEFGKDVPKQPAVPAYRDGYYMNAEGTRLIVLARTPVASGDLHRSRRLQELAKQAIDEANPTGFHPSLKVGLTGDVVTSAEQYGVIKNDLTTVGVLGVSMILLIDFLFFLRIRAVIAMALAIGIGVLWTFGVTRLVIGHLNTASGFLVSIIFGNGINFGILLRARYGEARRANVGLREALELAYRDTLLPTLTVAAAAGAGYLSLATTNFRGFRDFGAIGGYGMLLCWFANYLLMPPLLVVFERVIPTFTPHNERSFWGRVQSFIDRGVPFGAPFAWLSRRIPASVLVVLGAIATSVGLLATIRYIVEDPFEYNLGRLENDGPAVVTDATRLGSGMTDIAGRTGQDGMAIMTERVDQVKPLLHELEQRRTAGGANPPFQKVVSIFDLIPDDQAEKIRLLGEIRQKIDKVRAHGKMSQEDRNKIQPYLRAADLRPFGIDDLPEKIVRPFTERDGTRGRIVYVVPTDGKSVRDMKYLMRWADSYRQTTLPSGEVIYGSGRSVIYADMLKAVVEEGPKAALFAGFMTILVVIAAFKRGVRGWRATGLVIGSLAVGLCWMGALLYFSGARINFLNFIAVPITIGIGVDYAINLVHRWRLERGGHVPSIVLETGGAVVLCSLTTILGYLALMQSVNPAVRSFGLAAVFGELACLLAVVVVLPAVLILIERRANAIGVATPVSLDAQSSQ